MQAKRKLYRRKIQDVKALNENTLHEIGRGKACYTKQSYVNKTYLRNNNQFILYLSLVFILKNNLSFILCILWTKLNPTCPTELKSDSTFNSIAFLRKLRIIYCWLIFNIACNFLWFACIFHVMYITLIVLWLEMYCLHPTWHSWESSF